MAPEPPDLVVRPAGPGDVAAIARVRALADGDAEEPGFERRMAGWLAAEGDRRTTWLALVGDAPAGIASLLEYRRMPRPRRPDSRWGYVGNVFVCEELRNRGIGTALLAAIVTTADERGYARLVVSPSAAALPLYRRAGFTAAGDRLLVRPGPRVVP